MLALSKTPIHEETPSGSALRNPMAAKREAKIYYEGRSAQRFSTYLASPILAVQLITNSVFSIRRGNAKYIEKHQADRPSEIQWAPKLDPTSTKWRQNGMTSLQGCSEMVICRSFVSHQSSGLILAQC